MNSSDEGEDDEELSPQSSFKPPSFNLNQILSNPFNLDQELSSGISDNSDFGKSVASHHRRCKMECLK